MREERGGGKVGRKREKRKVSVEEKKTNKRDGTWLQTCSRTKFKLLRRMSLFFPPHPQPPSFPAAAQPD